MPSRIELSDERFPKKRHREIIQWMLDNYPRALPILESRDVVSMKELLQDELKMLSVGDADGYVRISYGVRFADEMIRAQYFLKFGYAGMLGSN